MKRLVQIALMAFVCMAALTGCFADRAAQQSLSPSKGEPVVYTKMEVPKGVPVLMYHKVGDETDNDAVIKEDLFRAQMQYLKDNDYHPITLDQLADYLEKGTELPVRPVVLTFDDGYRDTYTIVYPLLKKLGFVATVFINPAEMGERLTWEQVREMKEGGMIIASHGYNHLEMDSLSEEKQRNNIKNAQEALKSKLGIDNKWFCYPYGLHTNFTKEELKRQGLRGAVKMTGGWTHQGEDVYAISRVWVGNAVMLEHFAERVSTENYRNL